MPRLMELGRMVHFESRYARFDFDPAKVMRMVHEAIPQGLTFVLEDAGTIVGVFVGVIGAHFFGEDTVGYDRVLFVIPEHRGLGGVLLIREYVRRAKALGVRDIHLGTSTGIAEARMLALCEKLGFSRIGGFCAMEN